MRAAKLISTPIRYYGGKAQQARWIVSQMPDHNGYIEPFAGMLSVLLAKPIVRPELVNDTNHWLINWWRCVRDQPDELARLTAAKSRVLFTEACNEVKQSGSRIASGLSDALTFQTVIEQGVMHSVGRLAGWGRELSKKSAPPPSQLAARIKTAAKRLEEVQIECRDAIDVIELASANTLVYCDPPYHSSDTSPYGEFQFDKDKFLEAVSVSPCQIMISGYPGEWDELGWHSVTRRTPRMQCVKNKKPDALYMNFSPEQGQLL